jgi:hypothetical protein
MTAAKNEKPTEIILSVLDEDGWGRWCEGLGPEFADILQVKRRPKLDKALFEQNRSVMETQKIAFAAIAPRGLGVTRWAESGGFEDAMIRRRFALLGQTLDGQRVWDVQRSVQALLLQPDLHAKRLTIQGEREAAQIALLAGLLEPRITNFDLWQIPATFREGATFLNVLKILDVPQAVALALPRKIVIHVRTEADLAGWDWGFRLQRSLGGDALSVKVVGE